MTKPEVGASFDSWGTKLNVDLDLLDAVFLATGLGTSVGLHVGTGKALNVEGSMQIADSTDTTKRAVLLASQIATATTQTYSFPNASGELALKAYTTPTGTILNGYYGATPPPGFVLLIGRTIGDAASGATERANADTVNLYTLFWNLGFTPTGGRGANAAADFAAHKPMPLPDHRGRVMAGIDVGGSTVLAEAGTSTVRGGVLGQSTDPAQSVSVSVVGTISGATNGSLSYSGTTSNDNAGTFGAAGGGGNVSVSVHQHTFSGLTSGALGVLGSCTASGSGATTAVSNAQPTIMVDVIIAL